MKIVFIFRWKGENSFLVPAKLSKLDLKKNIVMSPKIVEFSSVTKFRTVHTVEVFLILRLHNGVPPSVLISTVSSWQATLSFVRPVFVQRVFAQSFSSKPIMRKQVEPK